VPLLINDRVDVAIAVNARGVHLGQTDMSVVQARSLLPHGSIIGVSCNNEDHVRTAVRDGADYVGIGAVWGTQTKKLTNPIVGVRNVGAMLDILDGTNVKAVAIGAHSESYRCTSMPLNVATFRWYQGDEHPAHVARFCIAYESRLGRDCSRVRNCCIHDPL
jgi:Thiamine monophosphate synthase